MICYNNMHREHVQCTLTVHSSCFCQCHPIFISVWTHMCVSVCVCVCVCVCIYLCVCAHTCACECKQIYDTVSDSSIALWQIYDTDC